MDDFLKELIARWAKKGIILDANLLILLAVGLVDQTVIAKHKKTRAFTQSDYALIYDIVSRFQIKVTLPNVMTEVSNLALQSHDVISRQILEMLRSLSAEWSELYSPSLNVMSESIYLNLGLTDAALQAISSDYLVVTADHELAGRITSLGRDVVNFNHFRVLV